MAWARIEFLTPQAKISCPRCFATWARIFAFGVKNFILALAIGWESYILTIFSNRLEGKEICFALTTRARMEIPARVVYHPGKNGNSRPGGQKFLPGWWFFREIRC